MGSSPSVKLNTLELPPRAPGLSRTLVLLHGYGADERDLLPIAHELDPRLRAVSLQGPIALGGPMRAWFNLSQDPAGRISFDAEETRAAVATVTAAVEEIAAQSPRPLLLGFSQGAGIAWGLERLERLQPGEPAPVCGSPATVFAQPTAWRRRDGHAVVPIACRRRIVFPPR